MKCYICDNEFNNGDYVQHFDINLSCPAGIGHVRIHFHTLCALNYIFASILADDKMQTNFKESVELSTLEFINRLSNGVTN